MSNLVELSGLSHLRKANKAQIAEFFDVSIKTVDGWVRRGCPVIKRGNRAEPWVMDALAVAEWRFSGEKDTEEEIPPDRMTPQDRKAWYESEVKRRDLQKLDSELIPSTDVERVIATAFAAISQDIRALPDNLERRHGISGETVEQLEEGLFLAMDALSDRLSALVLAEEP